MKKFSIMAVTACLVLLLSACGGSDGDSAKDDTCPVKVGFVTDMGGIDDRSFNQGSWEGVQQFAKDNKLDKSCYTYLESKTEADYTTNLSTLADDGYDIVIAAGYLFIDSMGDVAAQYPDTKFLIIDGVVEAENVESAVFAANESSYLAGMAAALEAKEQGSNDVGFIGGMEGEVIGAFQAGFEQGALDANPDVIVHVDYVGSYDDAGKATTLAAKQYDAGVKVIFHAAGNAGNGVIKEAQTRSEAGDIVYVVGVDKDQYDTGKYGDDDKSVILTSALKRVDVATYDAAKAVMDDKFEAGVTTYTLKENGVGIPEKNPNLSDSIKKALDKAIADIKDGTITVNEKPVIANGSSKSPKAK
ncbi:basic membrane protein A [Breznakia sp. PF5-3]|uniref:BMP family lipoprotein n=1 Tax=unclassified Breznakia TaxID=2623764 RepID=UPI0024051227|nr:MULTISPECIES: BMP family ABC transporter substrate-binding protein [unclassified Breznakia]MDF9825662.1 basic membrane protein A [Breznakia sp. PM6-1]MDF9836498.1 basic membrane protein A [Breznakia sp. PF5-3]MDF9838643.1 basic membrane protein A [Breznakia sp. PFB2-8]MDF9860674.1 basic membrane protein A [Breznakia sp. PH5-24]